MKIKHNKLGVGLFALIVTLSIASAGFLYSSRIDGHFNDNTYAAESREITNFTSVGNVVAKPNQSVVYTIDSLDMQFTIPDPVQYNAGDFLRFETKNIKLNLNNREVRVKDVIIGKVVLKSSEYINSKSKNFNDPKFQSLAPEDSATSEVYHLVFNDNFKKLGVEDAVVDISVINSSNVTAFVDHSFDIPVRVIANGVYFVDQTINIRGSSIPVKQLQAVHGGFYSSTDDGEHISNAYRNFWVSSSESSNRDLQVGDILEHSIDDADSGVAFDNKALSVGRQITRSNNNAISNAFKNPQGVYWIDEENKAVYEIIEASPYKIRYRVVEPPKGKAFDSMVNSHKLILLDSSPKTIDYENQKIKPVTMSATIYSADGQIIKRNTENAGSNISGAKLVSYNAIKKRGSVILKIQDEEGNKIAGFESDKLIIERQQEGTKYVADAPVIDGYEFYKLAIDSAPQEGVVKEGIQNVILIFKKKPIVAQPTEEKIQEPQKQEVQSPNTGIENNLAGSTYVVLAGIALICLTLRFLRK